MEYIRKDPIPWAYRTYRNLVLVLTAYSKSSCIVEEIRSASPPFPLWIHLRLMHHQMAWKYAVLRPYSATKLLLVVVLHKLVDHFFVHCPGGGTLLD